MSDFQVWISLALELTEEARRECAPDTLAECLASAYNRTTSPPKQPVYALSTLDQAQHSVLDPELRPEEQAPSPRRL